MTVEGGKIGNQRGVSTRYGRTDYENSNLDTWAAWDFTQGRTPRRCASAEPSDLAPGLSPFIARIRSGLTCSPSSYFQGGPGHDGPAADDRLMSAAGVFSPIALCGPSSLRVPSDRDEHRFKSRARTETKANTIDSRVLETERIAITHFVDEQSSRISSEY